MDEQRKQELDSKLEELVAEVASLCVPELAFEYDAEELGLTDEEPDARWYSAFVYGSSQGPSLGLIVAEAIGVILEGEEDEWEEVREWNLADELLDKLNGQLTRGGVSGEDNCLFWTCSVADCS